MAVVNLSWTERKPSADFVREDPLAFGHLEDHVANWLWPGITNRTSQAGYFVMVAYGLLIAEEAAKRYGLPRSDDTIRAAFARWERLWAMSICVAREGSIPAEERMRGYEGVLAAYRARQGKPPLDYQLIARQRELSALGAYLTSLRDHRFVSHDRLRLTPLGWELAQWMWDDPPTKTLAFDEFVLRALDPRNSTIPNQVGRISLTAVGKRASLAAIRHRPAQQNFLWFRLLGATQLRSELRVLPEMARVLTEAHSEGVTDTRDILAGIQSDRWQSRCSHDLKSLAAFAIAFGDLSMSFRAIFDRMYQAVLSGGDEAEWGDCVRAAVPDGEVPAIEEHAARWRHLGQPSRVAALPPHGANFERMVRRMNTSNRYHTFESILFLHEQAQRILGRREGWIGREGESVFLRHSGYERRGLEATQWAPGYRMGTLVQLLEDVGQLS